MRVSQRFSAWAAALFLCLSNSGGGAAISQDENPLLHDGKLLAMEKAMASLKGKNPIILRESWWNGSIAPGNAKLIQQQLFKRNEYQFWLAVPGRDAVVSLSIYDSEGELVETEQVPFDETNVASTIVRPETTGIYYIRIALTRKTENNEDWAVIYGYR